MSGGRGGVFNEEDRLRELALAAQPVTTAMARLGYPGVLTVDQAMVRLEAGR